MVFWCQKNYETSFRFLSEQILWMSQTIWNFKATQPCDPRPASNVNFIHFFFLVHFNWFSFEIVFHQDNVVEEDDQKKNHQGPYQPVSLQIRVGTPLNGPAHESNRTTFTRVFLFCFCFLDLVIWKIWKMMMKLDDGRRVVGGEWKRDSINTGEWSAPD